MRGGRVRLGGVAALLVSACAGAAPVFPPGSAVGIETPAGFAMISGVGLFDQDQPVIAIADLPKDNGVFSFESVARRLRQLGSVGFSANGVKGVIGRGHPVIKGRAFRSWDIWLDLDDELAIVNVQVPDGASQVPDASVEAALRTITVRDALPDRLSALPFVIGDMQGFHPDTLGYPATGFLKRGTLHLSQRPGGQVHEGAEPVVTITSDARTVASADRAEYARQFFQARSLFQPVRITSVRAFEVDGASWVELVGTSGEPPGYDLRFYARFGPASERVVLTRFSKPASDRGDYDGRIRQLALSVRPRTP